MIDLIQEKLDTYNISNQLEEEYAIKEILQDIALYGLWRKGFFEVAAFQGGTSLPPWQYLYAAKTNVNLKYHQTSIERGRQLVKEVDFMPYEVKLAKRISK